jgi:large subunit ribosomal protein L13e
MTEARAKVQKKAGKQRSGRGFSREELKKAGINPKEALRFHIPIDPRRKTAHEENTETVKALLKDKKAKKTASKPKKKPKS